MERAQLETAIAALQAQRQLLGDGVVDTALGPLREKLAELVAVQAQASAQARRLVTVLFTDTVGSTQVAERFDAEDMLELGNNALARLAAVVRAHNGRVLRYTGDGLKAAFGVDAVREDDAERAVRCGLAMVQAAKDYGDELRRRWPWIDYRVRVGLHTGLVALGGGIEGDNTADGIAVNIAARMESLAEPGSVRMSLETHRHVAGVFDVVEHEPVAVKGVAEPMRTYTVQRARGTGMLNPTRGIAGLDTPMVGRDAELDRMLQALAAVRAGQGLRLLTLIAEPGVGKSRLLREFQQRVGSGIDRLAGRALPATRRQPYGLLRDIFLRLAGIGENDAPSVARQRFERAVAGRLAAAAHGAADHAFHLGSVHVLGYVLGLDFGDSPHVQGIRQDGRQLRSLAFNAAVDVLAAGSDQAPRMLVLEDLHWADPDTLAFLGQLWSQAASARLLVVCLARPTLLEDQPRWGDRAAVHERIEVRPLDEQDSQGLARALLRRVNPPSAVLHDLLTSRAGGNPFYMEELLKMLIDQGAVQAQGLLWSVAPERLQVDRVPGTLTGVLRARLDGLPQPERQALQQASVIGPVFADQTLAALDENASLQLPALEQRALVLRSLSGGSDTETSAVNFPLLEPVALEFAFQHQLLQQVVYDSVLLRERRTLHGRLARWLTTRPSATRGDAQALIAEHYERADDAANAAEYYARAAASLRERYALDSAIDCATRGLTLAAATDDALRWRLLLDRQSAYRLRGNDALQAADLDDLEALAARAADPGRQALVAVRQVVALAGRGDHRSSLVRVPAALALARQVGSTLFERAALSSQARSCMVLGEHEAALGAIERGLALSRAEGEQRDEAEFLTSWAAVATHAGDLAQTQSLLGQALVINQTLGDRRGACVISINLGDAAYRVGDHGAARTVLEDALRLSRVLGLPHLESAALTNLAAVACLQADHEPALAFAEAAVAMAQAMGSRDGEAFALIEAGHVQVERGQFDAARAAYAQARTILLALELPQLAVEAEAGLARVECHCGQPGLALDHVQTVLDHLAAHGHLDGTDNPLLIRATCVDVLRAAGDDRWREMARGARAELQAAADRIADPEKRAGFLASTPHHRLITEAAAGADAA